ncbi:hypothetical protein EVAR_46803_1 [Eumeta japonica]|uniref:Uncharacterized protein n=1 Tax=Eumeta variegata TaxID=151549 RepID=A0A4C1XB90_EUMVA|nr:hypothetical protein EVAR_46803_1 [Eumeta japonica]
MGVHRHSDRVCKVKKKLTSFSIAFVGGPPKRQPRVHLDEADDEEPRADCVTPRRRGGDLYLSFLTRRAPLTHLHLRRL